MSFFERARTGYEQLAGRADAAWDRTGPREVGEIDQLYRDLGLFAYLASTGRPYDTAAQEAIVAALRSMEERGAIREFVRQGDGLPAEGAGAPVPPPKPGGSDGIPTPPPERAGRHGDFLTQSRSAPPPPPPARGSADEDTSPPSTWGV